MNPISYRERLDRCAPESLILENRDLSKAWQKVDDALKENAPQHHSHLLRISALALLIIGGIALHCYFHHLAPKEFLAKAVHTFYQKESWIALGVLSALLIGAGMVIRKATHKEGKFWGDAHIVPINLIASSSHKLPYSKKNMVDLSYLEKGCSTLPATWRKEGCDDLICSEHDQIALSVILEAPIQALFGMAYNVVRAVVIPFYILGRLFQEKWCKEAAYPDQRAFEILDIPKQVGKSLYWAARTPFYATAYLIAGFYALIDPSGGRKLGRVVCESWMHDIPRQDSFWPCGSNISKGTWEGGGGPEKLGQHAFYWTGCWMKQAEIEVQEKTITAAYLPGEREKEFEVYRQGDEAPPLLVRYPQLTFSETPPTLEEAKELEQGHWHIYSVKEQLYFVAQMTNKENGEKIPILGTTLQDELNKINIVDALAKSKENDTTIFPKFNRTNRRLFNAFCTRNSPPLKLCPGIFPITGEKKTPQIGEWMLYFHEGTFYFAAHLEENLMIEGRWHTPFDDLNITDVINAELARQAAQEGAASA